MCSEEQMLKFFMCKNCNLLIHKWWQHLQKVSQQEMSFCKYYLTQTLHDSARNWHKADDWWYKKLISTEQAKQHLMLSSVTCNKTRLHFNLSQNILCLSCDCLPYTWSHSAKQPLTYNLLPPQEKSQVEQ